MSSGKHHLNAERLQVVGYYCRKRDPFCNLTRRDGQITDRRTPAWIR